MFIYLPPHPFHPGVADEDVNAVMMVINESM